MKALTLILVAATLCGSALGQEQRTAQSVPAKAYNVLSNKSGLPEIVGRIPSSPNLEIKVQAESITSEVSIILKGKAEVSVSTGGAVLAVYEGPELVLTPVEAAVEPLNYQRVLDRVKEFDAAVAARDSAAIAAFFSKDAKPSTEMLTKNAVGSRTFTPLEFGEYMKGMFPNALRITALHSFNRPEYGSTPPEERVGTYMKVAPDGITATGNSNVRYVVTLPEGQIEWDVNRRMAVELRGKDIFITSLDVKIPQQIKENWPESDPSSGSRAPRRRIIQAR